MEVPMATVRLAADELDPKQISRVLDVQPEVSARKGERLYPGSKSKAIARTGTWFLSSDGSCDVKPEAHLQQLVSIVSPHVKMLRDLTPDLNIKFSLYLASGSRLEEGLLSNSLRHQAEDLGSLEITVA